MKLPNALSIILMTGIVAALTAIAGEWPEQVAGWLPLAGAAIITGVAKAVQVWLDSRDPSSRSAATTTGRARQWLTD